MWRIRVRDADYSTAPPSPRCLATPDQSRDAAFPRMRSVDQRREKRYSNPIAGQAGPQAKALPRDNAT